MGTEQRPNAAELDLVTTVLGAEPCGGVGWFRFWFADQRWEWSEEVARMYGYSAADTEPSTDLLLSHKHPDDRDGMAASIATALETGEPICGQHRILDSEGQARDIIVVGDHLTDEDGATIGTCGFFVDITETIADERNEALSEVLPELIEARAVIEQAKGALVLAYGISPEQAFRVLSWRSQETNTKLRDLAVQLVDEFRRLKGQNTATRTRVDHIVLTAHRLVPRD
ncbi:PAS and ANTAR domain-containing protein [Nocardia spumae]|uniref:PAS and ANTAR domain-containing protein n=1 Tax=Nocardia spumae TaxID=2887190 RepID=UPI001D15B4DE|nr:PAS and ANTAR domain-containing protein [Nocardia spumae]